MYRSIYVQHGALLLVLGKKKSCPGVTIFSQKIAAATYSPAKLVNPFH